jgi:hypothetical protein
MKDSTALMRTRRSTGLTNLVFHFLAEFHRHSCSSMSHVCPGLAVLVIIRAMYCSSKNARHVRMQRENMVILPFERLILFHRSSEMAGSKKKRQSMRETNQQTNSVSSSHHYGMGQQVDPMADDLVPHSQSCYDTSSGPLGDPMYLSGRHQDARIT